MHNISMQHIQSNWIRHELTAFSRLTNPFTAI